MLEKLVSGFPHYEQEIHSMADEGYAILINLRTMTPELVHSTYPPEWQDVYTKENLVSRDPTVHWALTNIGSVRWSEIKTFGIKRLNSRVFEQAKGFGLNFGVIIVIKREGKDGKKRKSLFGAARSDREFTDEEISKLGAVFSAIINDVNGTADLTQDETRTLTLLSLGLTQDEVASELGLTKDAVTKRIANCRRVLKADNTTHAVALAVSRGLIQVDSKVSVRPCCSDAA